MPRIKRENGGIGVRLTVSLLDDPAVHIFLARLPSGKRRSEVIRILREYLITVEDPATAPEAQLAVVSAWLQARTPQGMNATARNTSNSVTKSISISGEHEHNMFKYQPPSEPAAPQNTIESAELLADEDPASRRPDSSATASAIFERWILND